MIVALLTLAATAAVGAAESARTGRSGHGRACADPYPAARDPSNPLMLPASPGANPLTGAHFFVDGPRHGAAASAIARMLGRAPERYGDSYSWREFKHDVDTGTLHAKLLRHPILRYKVHLLEKIAEQPEAQRFSLYSGGGGPGAIRGQVQKIFCGNLTADPGAIPIITTYFLYQAGYCESLAQIRVNRPRFQRQVDEMAKEIGRRPAVMLLEIDGIGSSGCMARTGALGAWEADIRYEVEKVTALPHTVVYVEAGY